MSGECNLVKSEVKVTILIEAVIYTVRTVNLRGENEMIWNAVNLMKIWRFWVKNLHSGAF